MDPKDKALLQEEADKMMFNEHQNWLQHPITNQLVKNLKKHRDNTVNKISAMANNDDNDSKNHLQILAINIAKLDAIAESITNSQLFIANTKK